MAAGQFRSSLALFVCERLADFALRTKFFHFQGMKSTSMVAIKGLFNAICLTSIENSLSLKVNYSFFWLLQIYMYVYCV